jgi:hypothetical protein
LNQGSLGAAEEKNVSGLQWSQKCQWKFFHGFKCISMGNWSCLVWQVTWQVKLYSVPDYMHVSRFVPHSSIHATVHIVLQLHLSTSISCWVIDYWSFNHPVHPHSMVCQGLCTFKLQSKYMCSCISGMATASWYVELYSWFEIIFRRYEDLGPSLFIFRSRSTINCLSVVQSHLQKLLHTWKC